MSVATKTTKALKARKARRTGWYPSIRTEKNQIVMQIKPIKTVELILVSIPSGNHGPMTTFPKPKKKKAQTVANSCLSAKVPMTRSRVPRH